MPLEQKSELLTISQKLQKKTEASELESWFIQSQINTQCAITSTPWMAIIM